MNDPSPVVASESSRPWFHGITAHQWLVLLIASLGWIFDVFEGQVFVASMEEIARELLGSDATEGTKSFYNNISLAMFLLGGAIGGVFFGVVSDRIGRSRTMILTILMYSAFTCLTAFAWEWWHVALLRFLVAMGVGGEWAVASSMVAEQFPARARAWSGAIFHASSVFGTFLAVLVGEFIVANPQLGWRWAFGIGVVPALLTLWIRWKLPDPPSTSIPNTSGLSPGSTFQSVPDGQKAGSLVELFSDHFRNVVIGVSLATIGLATFWGVHIYGKNTLKSAKVRVLEQSGISTKSDTSQRVLKRSEMTGMFLTTIGGGIGLLAFGPLCSWLGRRRAFVIFHVCGFVMGLVLFGGLRDASLMVIAVVLPVFGFLTLGMHAGYAVYFPELFPKRLRGTGAGFCFNVGRVCAAPVLFGSGWAQKRELVSMNQSATALSFLFLLGLVVLCFAQETKGTELR